MNSKVPFDLKRAKNGEKDYAPGTLFEPKNGVETFALAAYFDPDYLKIIRQATHDHDYMNWRMALDAFTTNKKKS